jgi:hypothetical protein
MFLHVSIPFSFLICFMQLLMEVLEHDLFLCPFVTHFMSCTWGSDLGQVSFLFLLFPPWLGAFSHKMYIILELVSPFFLPGREIQQIREWECLVEHSWWLAAWLY